MNKKNKILFHSCYFFIGNGDITTHVLVKMAFGILSGINQITASLDFCFPFKSQYRLNRVNTSTVHRRFILGPWGWLIFHYHNGQITLHPSIFPLLQVPRGVQWLHYISLLVLHFILTQQKQWVIYQNVIVYLEYLKSFPSIFSYLSEAEKLPWI